MVEKCNPKIVRLGGIIEKKIIFLFEQDCNISIIKMKNVKNAKKVQNVLKKISTKYKTNFILRKKDLVNRRSNAL